MEHMTTGANWQAFQRLDNAAVVDFLTSAASALCDKGLLNSKDSDNLRLVLSGIHSDGASRERSLLLELAAQNAEFLTVLSARYGTVGFCLNLIRHTLRSNITETHKILSELGQALLKKSTLLFNRPFAIYRGGVCQKQTLFSTVIIDFAATLAEACKILAEVQGELALMNPNAMAAVTDADLEVDMQVARALGFKGLVTHSLPMHMEAVTKRKISQALTMVAESATELSEQLAANTGIEAAHDIVAACEWLRAECQRLTLLEFPQADGLMAWEVRRRNLTACVHGLNEALRLVANAKLASIATDKLADPNTVTPGPLPESVGRRLTSDMIATGLAPALALAATQDLLRYLLANRLAPHAILVGELHRINPHLPASSLATLTAICSDASMMTLAGAEKKSTMNRARSLGETFAKALPLLVCLCVGSGMIASCGLKAAPTSDIAELRPELPFHSEAPLAPKPAPDGNDDSGQSGPAAATNGEGKPDTTNSKGAVRVPDTSGTDLNSAPSKHIDGQP